MTKTVRLTQIDGALPNLALMKLAAWHRVHGDQTVVTRRIEPDLFEPRHYDVVYGENVLESLVARLAAVPHRIRGNPSVDREEH